MARKVSPLLLGGLGLAVAGLLFSERKSIMLFGQTVVDAAHKAIFKAVLPDYAAPYGDVMLRVADEQGVDPFLIFALGDRETRWGSSRDLDQPGPAGTGDGGHGHGLMQIDDRSWGDWLASHDWTDPYTNVSQGVRILKGAIAFFQGRSAVKGYTDGMTVTIDKSAAKLGVSSGAYPDPRPLSGTALWNAAIAAYNTGPATVLMAIAAGRSPEITTTGGDYATDVVRRASNLAAEFSRATV